MHVRLPIHTLYQVRSCDCNSRVVQLEKAQTESKLLDIIQSKKNREFSNKSLCCFIVILVLE